MVERYTNKIKLYSLGPDVALSHFKPDWYFKNSVDRTEMRKLDMAINSGYGNVLNQYGKLSMNRW